MLNIEDADIEFTETPTGFRIEATLSRYSAIIPLTFLVIVAFLVFPSYYGSGDISIFFFAAVLSILTWTFLVQAFGTQIIVLETPTLSISVGVGQLQWIRKLNVLTIEEVVIGRGTLGDNLFHRHTAIILKTKRSTATGSIPSGRFVFGHFLKPHQQRFVVRKFKEALASAA